MGSGCGSARSVCTDARGRGSPCSHTRQLQPELPEARRRGAQVKAACEAARGRDCQMGGFTRILHSGRPDELMDEIPTVVVDPLPDKENKGCGAVLLVRL
jgi:hypothetical protein